MAKGTYSGPVPADDPMFTGRYEIFSSTNTRADDPTFQEPVSSADGPKTVIHNADYWVKVVEFLQQNWALVDEDADGRARIFFINDASGIFDELVCGILSESRSSIVPSPTSSPLSPRHTSKRTNLFLGAFLGLSFSAHSG